MREEEEDGEEGEEEEEGRVRVRRIDGFRCASNNEAFRSHCALAAHSKRVRCKADEASRESSLWQRAPEAGGGGSVGK